MQRPRKDQRRAFDCHKAKNPGVQPGFFEFAKCMVNFKLEFSFLLLLQLEFLRPFYRQALAAHHR